MDGHSVDGYVISSRRRPSGRGDKGYLMDAERIDEIRRQIEAGEYETPERLAGAVEALDRALRGACIVPGCKNPVDSAAGPGDNNFCVGCFREFDGNRRAVRAGVAGAGA